jgi:hypothetical protein
MHIRTQPKFIPRSSRDAGNPDALAAFPRAAGPTIAFVLFLARLHPLAALLPTNSAIEPKIIAACAVQAMTLILLSSATHCYAQIGLPSEATGCFPINENLPDSGGDSWLYPQGPPDYNQNFNQYILYMPSDSWTPNHTYTVTIEGNFPVYWNWNQSATNGCPNVFLSAVTWDGSCAGFCGGAPDPYVSLSNLNYVSPISATFTATIGNAPPGVGVQIQLYSEAGDEWVWDLTLEPAQPPPMPSPSACQGPTIAAVTPKTWIAGKNTPIVITGANFRDPNSANYQSPGSCPPTPLTISAGSTGSENLLQNNNAIFVSPRSPPSSSLLPQTRPSRLLSS